MNAAIAFFAAAAALVGLWLLLRRRAGHAATVEAPRPPSRKARPQATDTPAPVSAERLSSRAALSTGAYDNLLTGGRAGAADAGPAAAEEAHPTLAFDLFEVDMLAPDELERLRQRLTGVSVPPRSVQQLMSPEFMEDASPRALTELLVCEPVLTARIIGRVNSPFYGLRSPISSVAHAITYLGCNAVRNMALQFAMEEALTGKDPELRRFQSQLLDVGAIAVALVEALAPKLGIRDLSATSTQTVLSFLGDFVVPRLLPGETASRQWALGLAERTTAEQFSLGANAMVIGQLLMEAWELPEGIREDVRDLNRVLVRRVPSPVGERDARLALGYACARIAEGVVLGRIQEPGQIDLGDECVAEFFQFQAYLARPPLQRLPAILESDEFARTLRRLARGRAAATESPAAAAG
ncbi:MAG: HDOD domain-containing protein [Gammaproteobacteria bacterium]|nr:HDOD domain-containing protein [Gammaproteobacteria bacterium]